MDITYPIGDHDALPYRALITMADNLQGFFKLATILIWTGISFAGTASVETGDEDLYIVKKQDNLAEDVLKLREINRGYPDRCRSGE